MPLRDLAAANRSAKAPAKGKAAEAPPNLTAEAALTAIREADGTYAKAAALEPLMEQLADYRAL